MTRDVLMRLCLAAAIVVAGAPAAAQPWPSRPVRIVAPFPPGGGTDTVARVLAQKFTEQVGASFVVENRPGAAGVLGAELVARAAPDGHTLLISAPEMSINPSMRSKVPYDALKDFAHISQLTAGQFMLSCHPSVPARSVKELIAIATSRPGQLNYSSSGTGGINHLAGELLQSMGGFRWVHVPFKGAGPAIVAAISGEVDCAFAATTGMVEHARAGKVRPLAVTGGKRFGELPHVPTVAEAGVPGYEVTGWYGFYAPAGTSTDIVRRLHAEARRGLNSPDVKDRLEKAGNDVVTSAPEEFAQFLRAEIAKWAKVIKAANLRVE
jgi:tripartite-type tricarboxylate transporter receptor subunit TctC